MVACAIRPEIVHGIQRGIQLLVAFECRLEELAGSDLLGADEFGLFDCIHPLRVSCQRSHSHSLFVPH